VLFASVEAQRSSDLATSYGSAYRLGGFLRISGLAQDQLLGTRGGLMRLLYYRELTRFDLGSLTQRMYAGFSVEAGAVYGPLDSVSWASLRRAGSGLEPRRIRRAGVVVDAMGADRGAKRTG